MAILRPALVVAALLALGPAVPAARADAPPPAAGRAASQSGAVVLEVGGGRVLRTGGSIANLFASDPKIAEVRPASHNSVFIFGVGVGRTTVAALDEAGNPIAQYEVTVRPSSYGAGEAAAIVQRALPGSDVRFSATPDGMTATGRVPNAAAAERVAAVARGYVGEKQTVDNRTSITSSVQVTLRVRIAEISRTITRQLGVNWVALANFGHWGATAAITGGISQATNLPNTIGAFFNDGTSSINTVLDMLAQDQLITMLAEPNLTARSGETASFLAGGEFPIPISGQNNQITVEFKQYGVSLAFVPTVLSDGRISLHVRPEVSELTNVGAVSVPVGTSLLGSNTITIPAITVRRADTTVELGSGESFAVAGLLTGQNTMNARGLPYLGELPVLGALFKSDLFQRGQSELVIVVTPYIVNPVGSPDRIRLPTDGFVPAGDVERVLLMRQRAFGTGPGTVIAPSAAALGPSAQAGAGTLPAGAGFILH
jgi:pilus assembly protein CpaC